MYFKKQDGKTNYEQIKSGAKFLLTKIFGGEKCRNFGSVPKILSAENLSAEFLFDKVCWIRL